MQVISKLEDKIRIQSDFERLEKNYEEMSEHN